MAQKIKNNIFVVLRLKGTMHTNFFFANFFQFSAKRRGHIIIYARNPFKLVYIFKLNKHLVNKVE